MFSLNSTILYDNDDDEIILLSTNFDSSCNQSDFVNTREVKDNFTCSDSGSNSEVKTECDDANTNIQTAADIFEQPQQEQPQEQHHDPDSYLVSSWVVRSLGNGICVEGHRDNANDVDGLFWKSGIIVRIIDRRTLVTASGRIYKLVGDIDATYSAKHGIPEPIIRAFQKGFPSDWINYRSIFRSLAKKEVRDVAPTTVTSVPCKRDCSDESFASSSAHEVSAPIKKELVTVANVEGDEAITAELCAATSENSSSDKDVTMNKCKQKSVDRRKKSKHGNMKESKNRLQKTYLTDCSGNSSRKSQNGIENTCADVKNKSSLYDTAKTEPIDDAFQEPRAFADNYRKCGYRQKVLDKRKKTNNDKCNSKKEVALKSLPTSAETLKSECKENMLVPAEDSVRCSGRGGKDEDTGAVPLKRLMKTKRPRSYRDTDGGLKVLNSNELPHGNRSSAQVTITNATQPAAVVKTEVSKSAAVLQPNTTANSKDDCPVTALVDTPLIGTSQEAAVKYSRSGRRCIRPLEYWRSERTIAVCDEVIIIDGTPNQLPAVKREADRRHEQNKLGTENATLQCTVNDKEPPIAAAKTSKRTHARAHDKVVAKTEPEVVVSDNKQRLPKTERLSKATDKVKMAKRPREKPVKSEATVTRHKQKSKIRPTSVVSQTCSNQKDNVTSPLLTEVKPCTVKLEKLNIEAAVQMCEEVRQKKQKKKKKETTVEKVKATVAKEPVTSIKQVTGGKGTLKRRRQLHDLMEAVNADDNDDYFASAPGLAAVAAKRAKHLDFSATEFISNSFSFSVVTPGPAQPRTPMGMYSALRRHNGAVTFTPVDSTPSLLQSANRSDAEEYVYRQIKSRRGRRPFVASKTGATPKASKMKAKVRVVSGLFDLHQVDDLDEGEEEDYYFTDE